MAGTEWPLRRRDYVEPLLVGVITRTSAAGGRESVELRATDEVFVIGMERVKYEL